ncbi:hypothetical protein SPRG_02523 [Saprolegnia parasitica CBS 223.65]|uniref:Uncharacterized protein n=1 Tax=Saprolegnia parasitica (strain CBS 223.65) TaxID=695850 RepID=A0A067CUA2_SAPPC|nr:hypothetical protein SPRG_02523 [Saprolegnia parasitica CBS 223.65]KDO32830.1 hypothetical protein SPRG_02523 [Saprolegnia parasitica CBS 223.65]|eukprot:XP_012196485.1 hypothetical protein SPRG_02523 [Saprolegnia parasitica CBS 223.65]
MLRLFSKRATDAPPASLEDATDFPALAAQLSVVEDRLRTTSSLLVRHSQALAELMQTSTELRALLIPPANDDDDTLADSVAQFRTTAIAPLQSLLGSFPHLRHRMDHRKSALATTQRYEAKVRDMHGESARLQRNRAKLHAAQERFQQLDADVRDQVKSLLALDVRAVVEPPLLQLAESQQQWATALQHGSQQLRSRIQLASPRILPKARSLDPQDDTDTEESCDKVGSFQRHGSDDLDILDKSRAMRPKHQHAYGTKTWEMHKHIKASLASGLDVLEAVQLPPGFAKLEWIAVHVVDFFNEVSLLYGTISELCTPSSCAAMTAGPCYTYLWADDGGVPTACSASAYVDKLLRWVEVQIENPTLFPSGTLAPPSSMETSARNILKRLFRVYAHIYHSHLADFVALHAESHLNFSFKRFVFFVLEFDLVEKKELNALRKLIATIAPGRLD